MISTNDPLSMLPAINSIQELKNPLKNRYLMRAQILVDDKVFLSTGNIAPGQIIKEAKPDIKLSAGEYKATAMISAIDPNTGKELDTVEQNISVVIKDD